MCVQGTFCGCVCLLLLLIEDLCLKPLKALLGPTGRILDPELLSQVKRWDELHSLGSSHG